MRFSMLRLLATGTAAVLLFFSFYPAKTRTLKPAEAGNQAEADREALEALQFFARGRAYPNADIPADAYGKAWDFYLQHFSEGARRTPATGSWNSIGPNNMGGRTLCIALQPNDTGTIWLGSASGGLWKSTSGGIGVNAWTYVPTGYPVLGVSSIAFHPTNPNIMFIGTGETYNYGTFSNGLTDRTTRGTHGMGILKSTDGGLTWTPSLNWTYQQNRGIWEIVFNPLNPNTLYAATTEGVYKSTDQGNSWNQVLNVQMVTDLVIHKTDTSVVMAGAGNLNSTNKGLYRTSDGGQNWNLVSSGLPANTQTGRITLSLWDDNNDIGILQICEAFQNVGIYKTTDKGANWSQLSAQDLATYQGWYAEGLYMQPGNQNNILAAGVLAFQSNDGGMNFYQTSNWSNPFQADYCHADIHDITGNPLDASKVYVATDGGLFRSNDFGSTFYECTDGYVTTQHYIGSVSATDPNMALSGLQDNYTNQYQGLNYWWLGVAGGDGCYNAIDPTNDFNQFAASQNLNVYGSYDRGQTFSASIINSPASAFGNNPAAFLAPYLLCPSDPLIMYAGGDSLIRCTDGGFNWTVMGSVPLDNGNKILSIAVSATQPDSVYMATAPDFGPMHIYRSGDGGATVTDISAGLPNRFPRRITVNPDNSRELYVVFSGFGTGHVFKSTNAGSSWTDISTSLPDVPFHCLAIDPDYTNVIYAGSDYGVFLSTDGGVNWTAHNTGLYDATMVFDLVVSPSDRGLLAFTHGHGVYKRSLNDVVGINTAAGSVFLFNVYPNPAQQEIAVQFEGREGQLRLFDMHGKMLLEQTVRSGLPVNIAALAPGNYLVDLRVNQKRSVKKILKI